MYRFVAGNCFVGPSAHYDAEDAFQDTFLAFARGAHNQAQRDYRPVAASSGSPHGTEGTVQGFPTSAS
jgi:hypothetical protein